MDKINDELNKLIQTLPEIATFLERETKKGGRINETLYLQIINKFLTAYKVFQNSKQ